MNEVANDDHDDDGHFIFVASITLRNGKRIFARNYGKKAFRIKVKNPRPPRDDMA